MIKWIFEGCVATVNKSMLFYSEIHLVLSHSPENNSLNKLLLQKREGEVSRRWCYII